MNFDACFWWLTVISILSVIGLIWAIASESDGETIGGVIVWCCFLAGLGWGLIGTTVGNTHKITPVNSFYMAKGPSYTYIEFKDNYKVIDDAYKQIKIAKDHKVILNESYNIYGYKVNSEIDVAKD
jgi:hypothetical protein